MTTSNKLNRKLNSAKWAFIRTPSLRRAATLAAAAGIVTVVPVTVDGRVLAVSWA